MILQPLSPEHAEKAWPLIEPFINQMAERFPDDWPPDRLRTEMIDAKVVPWVIWEESRKKCFGLGLTEVVVKPSGRKVLNIHAVGHDHKSWVHLIAMLERFGIENGCSKVEVVGREGWKRSLTDYKQEKLALFSKELDYGQA